MKLKHFTLPICKQHPIVIAGPCAAETEEQVFETANPFAVQQIADTLRGTNVHVLVKNPVNPDLELWIGALERLANAGVQRLGAIHRGVSTYEKTIYRNTPMWQIPIELRRRLPELPIFCDPSHMGGKRDLIAPLGQQAMDMGLTDYLWKVTISRKKH